MKNFIILIIVLFFNVKSFSQENIVPIKYGTSINDVVNDSIFNKFLINLEINILDYTIVSISDITEYTNFLRLKKNSYKVNSVKYTYTNILDFKIEKTFVHRIYENSSLVNVKQLMCWRTLSPDKNNTYVVSFYYVF